MALECLLVDDDANMRKTLAACLELDGHRVISVASFPEALSEAARGSFDVAFVDIHLGTQSGIDLIPAMLSVEPRVRIIVITAYASIETATEAMRRGAADYLPKPFTPAQVRSAVERVSRLRVVDPALAATQLEFEQTHPEIDLSPKSPAMRHLLQMAQQVAASNTTILLRGESGTGKNVLARAIHAWSARANRPFGLVSCLSLSVELLAGELFGNVKGAGTGASHDNPGCIAMCEGGTLVLDEIAEFPLPLQPKLLRFLQDREYERVGRSATIHANVRTIATSSVDLELAITEKRFREDLWYRLNVIQLELPPLRARPDDIPALAHRLLALFGRKNKRTFAGFTDAALLALCSYDWPGNLRELRNVVERATVLCPAETIDIEYLPANVRGTTDPCHTGRCATLHEVEEQHIRRVLASTSSLKDAAQMLEIDEATLWRKRKRYGI